MPSIQEIRSFPTPTIGTVDMCGTDCIGGVILNTVCLQTVNQKCLEVCNNTVAVQIVEGFHYNARRMYW